MFSAFFFIRMNICNLIKQMSLNQKSKMKYYYFLPRRIYIFIIYYGFIDTISG